MDTRVKGIVLKWELWGIVFVILLGALWHFIFQLTGECKIVGAIAPVNESVWEHFKLGFWPMCIFAAIEYYFIGKRANNFLPAKAVALFIIPVIIALIFYTYTAIVGHEILAIDITTFGVAVAIAQLISYRIMTLDEMPKLINYGSIVFIILLAVIFVIFTFNPPDLPVFFDSESGIYGLP
jgi:hypothetical protein